MKTERIDMTPVLSSAVAAVGYDAATKTMAVQMHGRGQTYHYGEVAPEEHEELMRAESVGRHLGLFIRGKKTVKRMTAQCPECKSEGWAGETCGDCGTAKHGEVKEPS